MNEINTKQFSIVSRCLLDSKWIYAKTMPEHPHWYTLRKDWQFENINQFSDVVQFIRDNHNVEYFYKKTMQRMNIDDYKYWSMGSALEKTILINRALIIP